MSIPRVNKSEQLLLGQILTVIVGIFELQVQESDLIECLTWIGLVQAAPTKDSPKPSQCFNTIESTLRLSLKV